MRMARSNWTILPLGFEEHREYFIRQLFLF